MKIKIFLYSILFFCSLLLNSQNEYAFIIESENGEVLENNQVLEFNSVQYPNASYIFFVRNLPTELLPRFGGESKERSLVVVEEF